MKRLFILLILVVLIIPLYALSYTPYIVLGGGLNDERTQKRDFMSLSSFLELSPISMSCKNLSVSLPIKGEIETESNINGNFILPSRLRLSGGLILDIIIRRFSLGLGFFLGYEAIPSLRGGRLFLASRIHFFWRINKVLSLFIPLTYSSFSDYKSLNISIGMKIGGVGC